MTWDGRLPAVLVMPGADRAGRRAALRDLAAAVLGVAGEAVAIRHADGAAPALLRPGGTRLHLSSASRGAVAAVAVAEGPVGIDVEAVAGEADIPWNVLGPAERTALRTLPPGARARAFARLWSVKEAYLKALGTGLAREPACFSVHLSGEGPATIRDGRRSATARTAWVGEGGSHALALVVLPRPVG